MGKTVNGQLQKLNLSHRPRGRKIYLTKRIFIMLIALTGGIASGKTFVLKTLENLGAETVSSDSLYRELIQPEMSLWKKLSGRFGNSILNADGTVDRKKLGAFVYASDENRALLNSITHPVILEEMKKRTAGRSLIVAEVPLLIEAGLTDWPDEIWVVDIPESRQLDRLLKREALTEEEAGKRISAQASRAERLAYADRIIDNGQSRAHTVGQVEALWREKTKK